MALGVFLFSDNLTENKALANEPFEARLSNWTPDGRFVETVSSDFLCLHQQLEGLLLPLLLTP